eukprot:scaffold758_cov123-Isochrysis_galbana.AAC.2
MRGRRSVRPLLVRITPGADYASVCKSTHLLHSPERGACGPPVHERERHPAECGLRWRWISVTRS